jgi:hypothetical protein
MKIRPYTAVMISAIAMLSFLVMIFAFDTTLNVKGEVPELSDPSLYIYEDEGQMVAEFGIDYIDLDGDEGTVLLTIDSEEPVEMLTIYPDPEEGQYYVYFADGDQIDDDTEFRFYAEDITGNATNFPPMDQDPLFVGNFDGWGEPPVLSNPDVYLGTNYFFNVTYQDIDGDTAEEMYLVIIDDEFNETGYLMQTTDLDPESGQNYVVEVLKSATNDDNTIFYFYAYDSGGSYVDFHDDLGLPFKVQDFDTSNDGGSKDDDPVDKGGGIQLSEGWAEVLVGVAALAAVAGTSVYGVYRRKKKHSRFSDLLTELDDIYSSYKLNPKRCELELEKIKGTINEDLKKSTIDDNNYSILKSRIDEILSEIRSESIRTEVAELPKDIELKIKDMLIDGEITRAEYDKILPLIKGSDMAKDDKEKTKKIVESWMKEEKEK